MTVLLVDWLGRGGIAQTTEAWAAELGAAGEDVVVVTRPDRELATSVPVASHANKVRAHQAVAEAAVRAIAELRPDVVVVQNYVLPVLEWRVHRAAARAGSRVVFVVHDHRLHTRLAGNHVGLRRCIRSADAVVTHTRFVAGSVSRDGRDGDVFVLPHPVAVGMLRQPRPVQAPLEDGDGQLAVHFGTLQRSYKGTSTIVELARTGVDGWRFALLGNGAPRQAGGAQVVRGFVDSGTLVAAVEISQATLLPYSHASQSGAVVLAQALGSAVIASAVGGIPEQVDNGVTGLLLPPDAPVEAWRQALLELADARVRETLASAGRRAAWDKHAQFVAGVRKLVA